MDCITVESTVRMMPSTEFLDSSHTAILGVAGGAGVGVAVGVGVGVGVGVALGVGLGEAAVAPG